MATPVQRPGFEAGNDCDAMGSAMEPGQGGPRESVVDTRQKEGSSGHDRNGADFWGIYGG